MDPQSILDDLWTLLGSASPSERAPETRLVDLGLSSIKVLRLIVQLERKYRVELPNEIVFECETAADLARAIAARLPPQDEGAP